MIIKDGDKKIDPLIKLTDDISLMMHPPTFQMFKNLLDDKTLTEMSFQAMAESIDYIIHGEQSIKDFTQEEVVDFFDNMTPDQLRKISDYIENLPKLVIEKKFKCSKCGYKETFNMENLLNFFIN